MKKYLDVILDVTFIIGCLLFIFFMGFFTGKGYELQKYEKRVAEIEKSFEKDFLFTEDFFVDSSYQYLEGHRLDIPNEISTLTHYGDREFDLLAAFIDDGGDIHLGFTGKSIKREEFLGMRDSLDFIEEHSKLTRLVDK